MMTIDEHTERDMGWLLQILAGQTFKTVADTTDKGVVEIQTTIRNFADRLKGYKADTHKFKKAEDFKKNRSEWLELLTELSKEIARQEKEARLDIWKRNLRWLVAVTRGASFREVAEANGYSYSRVQQIVEKTGRIVYRYAEYKDLKEKLELQCFMVNRENLQKNADKWIPAIARFQEDHLNHA